MLTYKLTAPIAVAHFVEFPGLQGATLCSESPAPIRRLIFFSSTVLPQRIGAGDLAICSEHAFKNWIGGSPEELLRVMARAGSVGLAYHAGTFPLELTAALAAQAREEGLALIELPPDSSMVEIVDSVVFNRVMTEQAQALRPQEGFYLDMIRASSQSGLQGIAVCLANLTRNPVVITNYFQRVLAYDLIDCDHLELPDTLTPLMSPLKMDGWPDLFTNGEVAGIVHRVPVQLSRDLLVETVVVPIASELSRMGYLYLFEVNKQSQNVNLYQMKQAAAVAYLELGKELEKKRQEKRSLANFIYNIIFGGADEHINEYAHIHQVDLNIPHRVVYFRIGHHRADTFLEQLEDFILDKTNNMFPRSLFLTLGDHVLAIIECYGHTGDLKRQIVQLSKSILEKIPPLKAKELQVGIGSAKIGIGGLRDSYGEARAAAMFNSYPYTNRVQFYEDMGILTLLSTVPKNAAVKYARDYLAPLLEYDQRNGSQLTNTLIFYLLSANMNIEATAAGLYLHPNTVRYRLHKVRELLGIRLEELASLVDLYAAVRLGFLWGELQRPS